MAITIIPGVGARSFRPPTLHEFDFRIEAAQGFVDTAGSVVNSVVQDAQIRTITADYSDPYYDIGITGQNEDIEISVSDATGALSGNRVSRVSDGTCRVYARHPWLTRQVTLDMSRVNDNVYDELRGYVTGSLARHIWDQTSDLIGSNTSANMPMYTAQNHTTSTYTRNPDCWTASLDLTAISPWNSLDAQYRAGVAISPRHTLHAKHYPVNVGTILRFITTGNVVVERTVEAVYDVPETPVYSKDVQIAKLNSDLPGTITPVKFLPANAYDYLPSWHTWKIPAIATNQFERMQCGLTNVATLSPVDWIGQWVTTEAPFATMWERVITRDSGSPEFVVINGAPVLICHWTTAGQGAAHHKMLTEIGAAMTSLGGGYSPATVDLSSFTDFS